MFEKTRRVLIVDDDEDTRTFVRSILLEKGWTIIEAANGQEAVDLALAERPDLVLLDLIMPVMDGFEAFRTLRAHAEMKDVKVIIFSNINSFVEGARHTEASIGQEFGEPQPDGFVDKPVEPYFLLNEIDGVMG